MTTKHVSYHYARTQQAAAFILGRRTIDLHGIDVPAEFYPWVVRVFNALCPNEDAYKRTKKLAARLAFDAVLELHGRTK